MKHLRNSLIGLVTLLLSFNSTKPLDPNAPWQLVFATVAGATASALYSTLYSTKLSKEHIDDMFAAAKDADDVTLIALLTLARNLGIHAEDIRNEQGKSLLHAIIQGADYEDFSEKTMTRIKIIEMLIGKFGMPVNIQDNNKQTASHYVSWNRDKDVVKAFLEKLHELGDDFKNKDTHNLTALDYFLDNFGEDRYSGRIIAGVSTICKSGQTQTSQAQKHTINDHFADRAEAQLKWNYDYSAMLRALRNDCKCEVSEELLERLKASGWKETDDEI